jgi:ferric iron reductase protein FhuF
VTGLPEVISAVQARVSYLRCATDAPPADGWTMCADLIGDPDLLRAEIDATAAGRGTTDPQVAASLYAQAYAFRVPSIAVAAYALGLPIPSTTPTTTAVRIARHRPAELAITDPSCAAMDVTDLAETLLDGHLAPFVEAVRATTQIGARLLWGNVAASIATIFRAVQSSGPLGDPDVRERAAAFEEVARAWLDGLGSYSTVAAPDVLGWYWTRTSCCLWYQTSSGHYCDDCSLHDPDELAARRVAELTAGEAG